MKRMISSLVVAGLLLFGVGAAIGMHHAINMKQGVRLDILTFSGNLKIPVTAMAGNRGQTTVFLQTARSPFSRPVA